MTDNRLIELENEYTRIEKKRSRMLPILFALALLDIFISAVLYHLLPDMGYIILVLCGVTLFIIICAGPIAENEFGKIIDSIYAEFEQMVLQTMGLMDWNYDYRVDESIYVKSKQTVDNYNDIKFFKEYPQKLPVASRVIAQKREYAKTLTLFLNENPYKQFPMYDKLEKWIKKNLRTTTAYSVCVEYTSPTGRSHTEKIMDIPFSRINELLSDKSLLMSKAEYSKYLKEQGKEMLEQKQHEYYERVNNIIDYANDNKELLAVKSDVNELDKLIASLFDRTINSIKKIKGIDSEEWDIIGNFIDQIDQEVYEIVDKNNQIIEYYNSDEFNKIKTTCDNLMASQREFNEYIDEKVKAISDLFGTRVVRNETKIDDEYAYIHPYKKSITPFTAEVSATVFASAENNPLEYVVKNFYPDKSRYPEQIQKLQLLIEELETLKEAKDIIENYKKDVQQYLTEVPEFIMEYDETGFYSRLGFATINENVLVVEYEFAYTSNGGKAKRSFTVPMSEETIIELIKMLESKLTMASFTKEQRAMMTSKLRQQIKERDDYTCKICGNSSHNEPNLLLEIDHIIPVSKGGCTQEDNLQTLCWKCNRQKSSRIL